MFRDPNFFRTFRAKAIPLLRTYPSSSPVADEVGADTPVLLCAERNKVDHSEVSHRTDRVADSEHDVPDTRAFGRFDHFTTLGIPQRAACGERVRRQRAGLRLNRRSHLPARAARRRSMPIGDGVERRVRQICCGRCIRIRERR